MSKTPQSRLDKLLSNMGYGSRKAIQAMARSGAIKLSGEALRDAEARVALTPDFAQRLTVEGRPVDPLPGMAVMLHKPLGVTCSHKEAGPLVYDLLPDRWLERDPVLSTVGRLDKDTSGLLLLTDDGALLHRIISPRSNLAKRYRAVLARPLKGDEQAVFASGTLMLESEDKPLLPAVLEPLSETEALLTITEGRYHQVRRMFAAVGNHVAQLHRDRIGGLELPDDLAAGEFRLMTAEHITTLFGA